MTSGGASDNDSTGDYGVLTAAGGTDSERARGRSRMSVPTRRAARRAQVGRQRARVRGVVKTKKWIVSKSKQMRLRHATTISLLPPFGYYYTIYTPIACFGDLRHGDARGSDEIGERAFTSLRSHAHGRPEAPAAAAGWKSVEERRTEPRAKTLFVRKLFKNRHAYNHNNFCASP